MIGRGLLAHETVTEEAAGFIAGEVVAVGDNRKQPPLISEDGFGGQVAGGLNHHPKLDGRVRIFGRVPAPACGGGFQHVARVGGDFDAEAERKKRPGEGKVDAVKKRVVRCGFQSIGQAHKTLITRELALHA